MNTQQDPYLQALGGILAIPRRTAGLGMAGRPGGQGVRGLVVAGRPRHLAPAAVAHGKTRYVVIW